MAQRETPKSQAELREQYRGQPFDPTLLKITHDYKKGSSVSYGGVVIRTGRSGLDNEFFRESVVRELGLVGGEIEPTEWLKKGDIIDLQAGHMIYAQVPEKYVISNRKKSDELTHHEVVIGGRLGGMDTRVFEGRYLVTSTTHDGGGSGMSLSPHHNDSYPDGHHVWCRKIKEDGQLGEEVNFYQSGAFSATITEIEPVGRADFEPRMENQEIFSEN